MTGADQHGSVWARVRTQLLALPRYYKRTILVVFDFITLSLALWASVSLRYNEFFVPPTWGTFFLLLAAPVLTVGAFAFGELYKHVTRYLGYRGHTRILACVWVSVLIWSMLVFMFGQLGVPRSVIVGYGIIASALLSLSRFGAASMLKTAGIALPLRADGSDRKMVVIFGTGQLAVELLEALRKTGEHHVVGLFDTLPTVWGQFISGVKVYRPEKLPSFVERERIEEVLIALPEEQRQDRRRLLRELERMPVAVKVLPAMVDIAAGRVSVTSLRPMQADDLLGREAVPPNPVLMQRNTTGKSILVTGAGGSVGSELAWQILKQNPRRLVLLDIAEPALYKVEHMLFDHLASHPGDQPRCEIIDVLGSVLDADLLTATIREHQIETIYHAAAYKHVPIVERNPIIGLNNNAFGAATLAECAVAEGVERVVLISTDKAVRPTNVMGASKRLAELILQAQAKQQDRTVFTMVRFGNVLNSSGSVVQKFQRQINAGGPVTVTHPEVIRYFMSIPEAAELVIQAGAMAHGGEVFVLDMGEPVKIDDLARLMIKLSGLEVKSVDDPDGDIAIEYVGLRPGEKLYEELLIGANTTGTEHPRILRSAEPSLPPAELNRELEVLKAAMSLRDVATIQAVLARTVEGYRPQRDVFQAPGEAVPAWTPPSRTLH